jgi:hypothetical protein
MTSAFSGLPYDPKVNFKGPLPALASVYTPLGKVEYRLLQVSGFDHYGILRCTLHNMPFEMDTTPSYTAISYTWDEAERIWYGEYNMSEKPVRINGTAVSVRNKVANILCLAQQVRMLSDAYINFLRI